MTSLMALLQRIEQARTLAEVQAPVRGAAKPLGYDRIVMFSAGAVHDPIVGRVYWIEGNWFGDDASADADSYLQRCPVNQHVWQTDAAFFWSKTFSSRGERYRIVRRPVGEGLHGLQVPVFGRAGLEGAVSFGGERVDSSPAARLLLTTLGGHAFRRARDLLEYTVPALATGLSPREKEVLRWVAAGRRQAQIAATLGLSERTVENHLRRARNRLGVATTAQAVRMAMHNGDLD